ncbi:MAG: ABC transporter substrate-binding protein [Proteobacteria bacterium]|nr:ABC transporter substrate-binding protein [Pseudomonadota bacterium]
MRRWLIALALFVLCLDAGAARAQSVVLVGWCARNITAAAAPIAVAIKMGWFREAGFQVDLDPLGGSAACVEAVADGSLPYALASIEPLAAAGAKDAGVRNFYTAYQGNIYGLAVPADSPIRSAADLRGKRIGVTSLTSGGVLVARALAANAGLDPAHDITLVVVGEGAHAAALTAHAAVDALCLYDVQYAMVEAAGVPLRMLDNGAIAHFPSNGLLATDTTLSVRRADSVALARGYAMGTVFAIANPVAAVRILHEVWPQTVPDGMDPVAVREDLRALGARIPNWRLEAGGVTRWGESSLANYDAYLAFLARNGAAPAALPAADLVTNDLIPDINRFDADAVAAQARAWRP